MAQLTRPHGLAIRQQCTAAVLPPRSALIPSMHNKKSVCKRSIPCQAMRDVEDDILASGCPVPREQQPIQELKQLQDMFLFDWATMPVQNFAQKLVTVWLGFFITMGLPVSAFTFDLHKELLQCVAAASAGSTFIVTVLVWRLYLGWQHVGDRLISATVEYEETGWYDGQVWVKPPQVLMRDRLMSNYTVKPALARLKRTLLGLGGALVASMLVLAAVPPPSVNSAPYYDPSNSSSSYTNSRTATLSNSTAPADDTDADYEDTLSKYEPWALESDAGDAAGQYDMRSHMMMQE